MGRRIISLLLISVFLCCMGTSALAADVPDMTQKGTITVTMHTSQAIVPGGTLTLYRVGEVHEDDGNYSFVPTGDFAACGESFEDVQSPELASALSDYAKAHALTGRTERVAADGTATFSDLELGLYLLMQNEAADGYKKADPFLVSLPGRENGAYIYTVDASPKVVVDGQLPPTPTPTVPSEPKLPQTGQLNWPVPLLAAAGLLLFSVGWALFFGHRKNDDEA